MPIIFRAASPTDNPAATTTTRIAIAPPTGIQFGDLLIAFLGNATPAVSTITAPDGWTHLRTVIGESSAVALSTYYKFSGNEPDRWVWSYSGAAAAHGGAVVAYAGVNRFYAIEHEAGKAEGSTALPMPPNITTSVPSLTVVACVAVDGSHPFAAGWPPTEFVNQRAESQHDGVSLCVKDQVKTTVGESVYVGQWGNFAAPDVCVSQCVVLRPSPSRYTAADARSTFRALLPPGADDLYDYEDTASEIYKFLAATCDALKEQGFDYPDLMRTELDLQHAAIRLPDWEAALAVSLTSATPAVSAYGDTTLASVPLLTRQAKTLGRSREQGPTTINNVRTVIEPLLGYTGSNLGTLLVREVSRSALAALHTRLDNVPAAIPAGWTLLKTIYVNDDGDFPAAGAFVRINITHPTPADLTIRLAHRDGVLTTCQPAPLPAGAAVGADYDVWCKTMAYTGPATEPECFGTWTLAIIDAGAAGGTLNSWTLFVEAVGYNDPTFPLVRTQQGRGAAIYEWGVQPEESKMVNPDIGAVRRALARISPAYGKPRLIWQNREIGGGTFVNYAIPDYEATTQLSAGCIPDEVIPGI